MTQLSSRRTYTHLFHHLTSNTVPDSEMAEVVAELDRRVGRWHSLQEASLLKRARWLLTGEVPADHSTDQQ